MSLISAARAKHNKMQNSTLTQDFEKLSVKQIKTDQYNDFTVMKSSELKDYVNSFGNFLKFLPKGYSVNRKLGKGAFGTTMNICKNNWKCMACKVQQYFSKQDVISEFHMQKKFAGIGIAPDVISVPTYYKHGNKEFAIIYMSAIDGVVETLLEQPLKIEQLDLLIDQILFILKTMRDNKLTMGDAHFQNIVYKNEVNSQGVLSLRIMLIDFGWSSDQGSDTFLELIQMLRTLHYDYAPNLNEENRTYLTDALKTIIMTNYDNIDISTQDLIELEWTSAMDLHANKMQR